MGKKRNPKIRVTVLGLARRDDEILVSEGYDSLKDEKFYRLLGGGVEFWEESLNALKREFKEELHADILSAAYLCKVENMFIFEAARLLFIST